MMRLTFNVLIGIGAFSAMLGLVMTITSVTAALSLGLGGVILIGFGGIGRTRDDILVELRTVRGGAPGRGAMRDRPEVPAPAGVVYDYSGIREVDGTFHVGMMSYGSLAEAEEAVRAAAFRAARQG